MTEQAANTLLKTLEEPTAPVIFLLVAESEDDFPPTIASRCRTVHFGRVPDDELTQALVERGITADAARVAAMVAGGRPGLALALATRPEVARVRQAWLSLPERVTARPGDGFALAEEMLATLEPLAADLAGGEGTAEARDRAKKRATQSLLAGGLEILASFYADGASLATRWARSGTVTCLCRHSHCPPGPGRRQCAIGPRCRGRPRRQPQSHAGAGVVVHVARGVSERI